MERALVCAAQAMLCFDQRAYRAGRRHAKEAIMQTIAFEIERHGSCATDLRAVDHALREPTRAELELGIRRIMRALGVETWAWDRPDFAVMEAVGRRVEAARDGKDNRATGRVDAKGNRP